MHKIKKFLNGLVEFITGAAIAAVVLSLWAWAVVTFTKEL